jgi:histidyl-tRNA synthetase
MVMETLQIRLTKGLVKEIQKLVDKDIYSSVSEAVRDSVRRFVLGQEEKLVIPEKQDKEQQDQDKQAARNIQKKIIKEIKKQFSKPTGTVDFYPKEESIKSQIFKKLRQAALNFNFKEVDTPIIESLDLLKAKQGDEILSQIFTIEKKGDEEFGIRAEFTPSLARMFVSKQKELPKPVKWFCINKVLRYERPQKGRLREFFQFNCEIYGSSKAEADAELINLITASLKSLGLTENDFKINLNNRKLMIGLIEEINKGKVDDILATIDKRKKITDEDFNQKLTEIGLNNEQIQQLNTLLQTEINNIKTNNKQAQEGLDEIKQILELTDNNIVKFDIETVRGLAYYTGTVFEVFDKEEKFRSIAGGGRYDQMIELFKGEPTPATGFGLGYATLSLLLKEKNLLPEPNLAPDYFIIIVNDEVTKEAIKIANKLREKYKVELDLNRRNIGKQFKYADSMGAKKAIVIGPDELKQGKVKVKDMVSRKEELVDISSL